MGSYKRLGDYIQLVDKRNKDLAVTNLLGVSIQKKFIISIANTSSYNRAVLNENAEEPSYYIKCSFISTINDESHKVTALDSIYYQKIINEQPQLLFDIFKEIFVSIGKEHYELMMDVTI